MRVAAGAPDGDAASAVAASAVGATSCTCGVDAVSEAVGKSCAPSGPSKRNTFAMVTGPSIRPLDAKNFIAMIDYPLRNHCANRHEDAKERTRHIVESSISSVTMTDPTSRTAIRTTARGRRFGVPMTANESGTHTTAISPGSKPQCFAASAPAGRFACAVTPTTLDTATVSHDPNGSLPAAPAAGRSPRRPE